MFGYKCDKCGKGIVRTRQFQSYETKIDGIPFTIENAVIGVCDQCGARYFNAREIKKWRESFYRHRARVGGILSSEDITKLRQEIGLTVADFARLIGCSRQAVYLWESVKREVPQSRMADLMIKLVRKSFVDTSVDVLRFLLEDAVSSGWETPQSLVDLINREDRRSGHTDSPARPAVDCRFDRLFSVPSKPLKFKTRLRLVA